jgi:hypothetical protein
MSRLSINFGPYVGDTGDAVVPLEVIDHDMKQVWRQPCLLNQPISVSVQPGTYLVRAHLPSGELVTAQTSVAENETKDVNLTPVNLSPRETLAWAYYLKPAPWIGQPAPPEPKFEPSIFQSVMSVPYIPPPEIKFWIHKQVGGWKELPVDPAGPNQQRISVKFDPSVQQADPRALMGMTVHSDDPARNDPGQLWLQIRQRNISQFVALPPGQNMRVLILDDEPTALCMVDSENPRAEALLGYLMSGDYGAARDVGEDVVQHAEKLLEDKISDPGPAAIGAYYLLRAGRLDRLHDWTRNLANWFPWMPDGAVICGWHLLREPTPNLEQALTWFLEAEQRGIPLYAQGLRLLFDGLRLFQAKFADEGGRLAKAVDRLRPYLAAARAGSGTTCFFGERPDRPDDTAESR